MTTLNLQVSLGTDDGSEGATGVMSITTATSTISSVNGWYAARLQNVTIPKSATINTATLQVFANSTANDNPAFNIYCEANDNAPTLTTDTNNISNRSRTTANVNYTGTDVGTGFKSITGFSAPVQEVINRAGWVSGNAIMTIWDAQTGVAFAIRNFESASTDAVKLDIDYSAGHGLLLGGKRNRLIV